MVLPKLAYFVTKTCTGVLVYNVNDPRACQETGVGRRKSLKKVLVGECLQCVKEPIIKVDKNAVAVVFTNSHCKKEVAGHTQQKCS